VSIAAPMRMIFSHTHHSFGNVDVYPVGALRGLQQLRRSLDLRVPLQGHRREAIRHSIRYVRRGWRRGSHWNGYLAEPTNDDIRWTQCGHGWTKRRALASLKRHVGEVQW